MFHSYLTSDLMDSKLLTGNLSVILFAQIIPASQAAENYKANKDT